MVRIYYTEDSEFEDQRLPRQAFPPKQIPLNRLLKKTGVAYYKVELGDLAEYRKRIDMVRAENKYGYVDECVLQEGLTQDYDEKLKKWFEKHIHEEDEARLVLEGSAYYDVLEPKMNKWIRLAMEPGDLVIIPPGCMHRFTPDMRNFVKLRRFSNKQQSNVPTFNEEEALNHPAYVTYVARFKNEPASPTTTPEIADACISGQAVTKPCTQHAQPTLT